MVICEGVRDLDGLISSFAPAGKFSSLKGNDTDSSVSL
jgi:hypothetical protein